MRIAKGILKLLGGTLLFLYAIATYEPILYHYGSKEALGWFQQISPFVAFVVPFFFGWLFTILGMYDLVGLTNNKGPKAIEPSKTLGDKGYNSAQSLKS